MASVMVRACRAPSSRAWDRGGAARPRSLLPAPAVMFTLDAVAEPGCPGWAAGQPVGLSFLLSPGARRLRQTFSDRPLSFWPGSAGAVGWFQDSNVQDHLWAEVTGTGLTGSWNPAVEVGRPLVRSSLEVTLGRLGWSSDRITAQAQEFAGHWPSSGLRWNEMPVVGFEFSAGCGRVGAASAALAPGLSDPCRWFLPLTGTQPCDPRVPHKARLLVLAARGVSVLEFRVRALTVSAVPGLGITAEHQRAIPCLPSPPESSPEVQS